MKKKNNARVLFLDIETSLMSFQGFRAGKSFVRHNQIVEGSYMLSFCAKWLGNKNIIYHDCRDILGNDQPMLIVLKNLMEKADIIVTHNGINFDIRYINARFVYHKMNPPSDSKQVDTYRISKRKFLFDSYSLDFLSNKLCKKKKNKHKNFHGMDLWQEISKSNRLAWDEMKRYNIQDVLVLEELYFKLLPFNSIHPNVNLYSDNIDGIKRCPKCGSGDIIKKGFQVLKRSVKQKYLCNSCGGWCSSATNELPLKQRRNLLDSI